MLSRTRIAVLGGLCTLLCSGLPLPAEDKKQPETPNASPSLQQQIDELKAGQQRLLRELDDLKRLVQEKPARADYPPRPQLPSVLTLNVQGEPFRGQSRARVAIVEYSDFDCSFCGKYAREVFPLVDRDYLQPGKVKYFFGDLPEGHNTNAFFKARVARCAAEQGRFWEMHDHLFAAQAGVTGKDLLENAKALGLDTEKFGVCLSSERYADEISRSMAAARRAGIYGTPAFMIGSVSENGELVRATKFVVGAATYEPLKVAIEEVLAATPEK